MFAKDTSLRNSMREEFQVCSYPVIQFYNWILAQLFSAGFASGSRFDIWHQSSLLYKSKKSK